MEMSAEAIEKKEVRGRVVDWRWMTEAVRGERPGLGPQATEGLGGLRKAKMPR